MSCSKIKKQKKKDGESMRNKSQFKMEDINHEYLTSIHPQNGTYLLTYFCPVLESGESTFSE